VSSFQSSLVQLPKKFARNIASIPPVSANTFPLNMSAELTYQDVAEHNTKSNIYVVIHDKIYNASKFIDEHPYALPNLVSTAGRTRRGVALSLTKCYSGGEEVLLDVAGQDATEAFEDVGHSDEARETLSQLQIGVLKRMVSRP
jgi:cytochrome b involved in lipid metabolism